ncbi:riboflavin synthase [Phreatobacter sp. AB_2022a]|uniref:riboflavin synthase n=1 Tax=Phreatobacter sp. AB_2022a TaxID=3003134 RepID=UPI0022872BFA|nr:riboflavin synthase [Phreatobacter sp. AB_2022a]MCZ0736976.1 riboflavin synthase [Phreatobacter sp. AB_2022a]
MFTGIITDIGEILAVKDEGTARHLTVACAYPADTIPLGASICHMGVCLTVTSLKEGSNHTVITVDASAETLARTTIGSWEEGRKVNLERALRIGDELGGHIVTGHVDGVAEIIGRDDKDGTASLVFRAPRELAKFIAEKGSVGLDGTSLTVNGVKDDTFTVTLIPHTLAVTTWGEAKVGDRVNLEVDMMARYSARLAEAKAEGY